MQHSFCTVQHLAVAARRATHRKAVALAEAFYTAIRKLSVTPYEKVIDALRNIAQQRKLALARASAKARVLFMFLPGRVDRDHQKPP